MLTFFGQGGGGILQMRTSALYGAKNFGFFEIYGMSARTRGKEVNFSLILCPLFYGRAPNHTRRIIRQALCYVVLSTLERTNLLHLRVV